MCVNNEGVEKKTSVAGISLAQLDRPLVTTGQASFYLWQAVGGSLGDSSCLLFFLLIKDFYHSFIFLDNFYHPQRGYISKDT